MSPQYSVSGSSNQRHPLTMRSPFPRSDHVPPRGLSNSRLVIAPFHPIGSVTSKIHVGSYPTFGSIAVNSRSY